MSWKYNPFDPFKIHLAWLQKKAASNRIIKMMNEQYNMSYSYSRIHLKGALSVKFAHESNDINKYRLLVS